MDSAAPERSLLFCVRSGYKPMDHCYIQVGDKCSVVRQCLVSPYFFLQSIPYFFTLLMLYYFSVLPPVRQSWSCSSGFASKPKHCTVVKVTADVEGISALKESPRAGNFYQ